MVGHVNFFFSFKLHPLNDYVDNSNIKDIEYLTEGKEESYNQYRVYQDRDF